MDGIAYPPPSRLLQTTRSPSFGHLVIMPFSGETLSPVGPRKRGQSTPCLRVPRSGSSPADRKGTNARTPRMDRIACINRLLKEADYNGGQRCVNENDAVGFDPTASESG